MMREKYVSVTEASKIANLTRTQILRLCKQGRFLGAEKIGNVWIIPKASVENYEPAPKGFAAVWERRKRA